MDTIFGRRKTKPRASSVTGQELSDSSVPYSQLGPPPSSPKPVGTVSQGLRGGASLISAPITNPTLTSNGTELNKFAMNRSRAERKQAYDEHNMNIRPGSPSTVYTSDSATLYTDSTSSLPSKYSTPQTARTRRSQASSTSSGRRSPSMSDFGQYPPYNGSPHPPLPSSNTVRPMSTATTRSDNTRYSKHAPSLSTSESGSHHSHFYNPHRMTQSNHDDEFPKPDTDVEIEALFEQVARTRNLTSLPNLSIHQKWDMVHSDWQIRKQEERSRNDQARRQGDQATGIIRETPEWYISKFLSKTITPKQAGALQVSLRSKEMR